MDSGAEAKFFGQILHRSYRTHWTNTHQYINLKSQLAAKYSKQKTSNMYVSGFFEGYALFHVETIYCAISGKFSPPHVGKTKQNKFIGLSLSGCHILLEGQ